MYCLRHFVQVIRYIKFFVLHGSLVGSVGRERLKAVDVMVGRGFKYGQHRHLLAVHLLTWVGGGWGPGLGWFVRSKKNCGVQL